MSQDINLVNPALAPKVELFQGRTVLAGLGAVLALCVLASLAAGWDAARLARHEQEQTAQLTQLNNDVTRLGQEVAARKPSATLREEMTNLDALLAARNEVMAIIRSGALGDTRGVSDYFRAFARQSVDGLWLTGFSIQNAGADIVVQGRTLDAELVPAYLTGLRRENALRGRGFAHISVFQPPEPPPTPEERQTAGFLEFRLATFGRDADRDLRDTLKAAR
jgi:hypothetical protein